MKDIFSHYRDKTLSDFKVTHESHERAVLVTSEYMDMLQVVRQNGMGLFIMGPTGVGKTFLASMVVKKAKEDGFKIEAIEMSTYIRLHQEVFKLDNGDERYWEISDHLRYIESRADFVLFDDIGREHESGSGWSNEILFDIFRYRWNRGRPTIFTSNHTLPELEQRYTEGFPSLLCEATEIILVEGEDYRRAKR